MFDRLLLTEGVNGFVTDSIGLFVIITLRYLIAVSLAFVLIRRRPYRLDNEDWHDLRLSVGSTVIFTAISLIAIKLYAGGHTRIYEQPSTYGWWYIGASYLIVLLLQDSYFYCSHRLFHLPQFYHATHRGHHRSRRPSAWTSFAFDPIESLAHASFLLGVVLVIPLHLITILAVLTTMTVWAVVNHLGLAELPGQFPHHWLGRWVIGPAHHSVHHTHQNKHYGLYFTFWDKLMGTEDDGYDKRLCPHRPVETSS
jgi:hypothetical protein